MSVNKSYTVLIVDDNPNNVRIVSRIIDALGYQIQTAGDGEQALESIKESAPDLILLDIHMPKLDGYEVCKQLKSDEQFKDIPVIFISASNEEINKVQAFKLGAVDYICTPFHIEETKARIQTHLELFGKIRELEFFNEVLINREMRIIELKKEVNEYARLLGKEEPYLQQGDIVL